MEKLAKITGLLLTTMLFGCTVAHVQPGMQSPDLASYDSIAIGEVKVYSLEPAAEDNEKLHQKLEEWQNYSTGLLRNYVERHNLELATDAEAPGTLLVDLDVNVRYGNRALRWAVGFGAGKGGVYPKLTARDASTGELKYDAKADAEMVGGGFGGDIGALLQTKVQKLVEHFFEATTQPRVAQSAQ